MDDKNFKKRSKGKDKLKEKFNKFGKNTTKSVRIKESEKEKSKEKRNT
jgi:hypothetical protein